MLKFLSKRAFKAGLSLIYSFLMYLSIVFMYYGYLQQQRISRMIAILFFTKESQRSFIGNSAPFSNSILSQKKLFSSLSSILLLFYFSLPLKYFCINDEYIIKIPSSPHPIQDKIFSIFSFKFQQYSACSFIKYSKLNLIIQMSELKFRINNVTSQHPRYPAGNLVLGQQGWQSAIDCEYPQSITIQFFVPIKTKKMHLLFHHYKIPKIVEVFVKLGSRSKYRKLGYVTPNDNTQSSFREKQEKTLYFEFSCTHIRLIFYENYKNDRNLFNQVALDDLNIFGEIISNRELIGVDLTEEESSDQDVTASLEISHNVRMDHQQAAVAEGNENNPITSTSPLFREIYEKLQFEKQIAVERQDYQKAAYLKKVLVNFQQLQDEINKMQLQKQQALDLEDYDRCHKLKHEISMKKQIVQFQKQQLFRNEQNFYSQHSFSRVVEEEVPMLNESKRQQSSPKQLKAFRSPEVEKIKASVVQGNQSVRYDQQVVPALLNKNRPTDNLPLQTTQKKKELNDYNEYSIPNEANEPQKPMTKRQNTQGSQKQSQNASKNESNIFQLEPLDNKLRLRVQTYFSFIPQKVWQLCQNKNWKAKQQALKFLKQKLPDVIIKEHFMGVIQMVSRIMTSKQATISIQALHIINKLADIKIKFVLQHMPFFVEEILGELLNFLNDTNKQIKELAYTTYLKLPEISFLGLSMVIREVIKHKNKVKNDPKLIITKLQLATALLEKYGNMEFPHKEIILWVLNGIEDPNQKVRSQAQETLSAVTFLLGTEKILKIVESSRPNMLQNLLAILNSSFQHSKIQQQQQSKLSLDNSKLHQQFYGFEHGKQSKVHNISSVKQSQKHIDNPIFLLQQQAKPHKMEQSKHSRQQNANVDLSYSKQSVFEQSIESNNISVGDDKHLEVYQDYGEDQFKECDYCLEEFLVKNERNHYVNECKVIAYCERCNGYIYIREFTSHLLTECEDNHLFTQCKKCGIAVELEEKNEHIGRDICKNKKGVNWERCQFCFQDVLAEDKFWIKHSKQCKHLPAKIPVSFEDELSQQQSLNRYS